jgi:hypothetical protein
MIKCAVYILVIISLFISPVIAGCDDWNLSANAVPVVKAVQDNAMDSHSKYASDHHCCSAHVHFGDLAAGHPHIPSSQMTKLRLPLLVDPFLAAFGPNPLLEPPSHA